MTRTYTELSKLGTFKERFEYLKLSGKVGADTFGFDRYINQRFYQHSLEWKRVRNLVIVRDFGCDLGLEGFEIYGKRIIIHHMNPLTFDDFEKHTRNLLDPEFLITTTHETHNAIHYGDESQLIRSITERSRYDTCPWRH